MYTIDEIKCNISSWSDELKSTVAAQDCLYEFTRQAWPIIKPNDEFVGGEHIKAVCWHLQGVIMGIIKHLIINVPPRMCKTIPTSIMLVPWAWIHFPHKSFLYSSASYPVALDSSVSARRVIESDWYQRRWGHIVQLDKNTAEHFTNHSMGSRAMVTINKLITGMNGDILIGDDLNDTNESDSISEKTYGWYRKTFIQRRNDRKKGSLILIAQRSKPIDVTGQEIERDKRNRIVKVVLPYEFEPETKCKTIILPQTNGKIWTDWRSKPGELIWPEREGPEELEERKEELRDAHLIAGQLQQRPTPAEGNILKHNNFRPWSKPERPKNIQFVIQSWDTAFTKKESSSYSVCSTWGLFEDDNDITSLILLSNWYGRVEFDELKRRAVRLASNYTDTGLLKLEKDPLKSKDSLSADTVLVENKASGIPLSQELRRAKIPAIDFNPTKYKDKEARIRACLDILDAGRIYVPMCPPDFKTARQFAFDFVGECVIFPSTIKSKDFVDTLSQVILYCKARGLLACVGDVDRKGNSGINPKNIFYGALHGQEKRKQRM